MSQDTKGEMKMTESTPTNPPANPDPATVTDPFEEGPAVPATPAPEPFEEKPAKPAVVTNPDPFEE
jgi:hypothetical protein